MNRSGFRITVALLLVSATANAQFEPIPSPHKRTSVDGLRHHYYASTSLLPDELALEVLLTLVASTDSTPDDKAIRIGQIQEKMGMSEGDARYFLQYLVKAHREYTKDLERMEKRMACSPGGASRSGDQIYSLFETMYAGKRALLAQHLAIIGSDLSETDYARFYDWLEETKLGTTYFTAHHKEAYEDAGVNPDQALNAICTHLMMVSP